MDYSITDTEFEQLSRLVYRQSGIHLPDSKKFLLVSRLTRRLRSLGLPTFQAYYERIMANPGGEEFVRMLDCISTNKTDFFREPKHFEFLRDRVLTELTPCRHIRVWSAACSSGEEPYTIAMTISDALDTPSRWECRILASDLSTQVLAKATAGIYEEERLRDLPSALLRRHFLRGRGPQAGTYKVKPHLSAMVQFRRINLMDDRYPIRQPLDVIFCRNVMIYFDRVTQQRLLGKFLTYLRPGGYLFIGHSESLQWIDHEFRYVAPTIYQKTSPRQDG